MNLSRYDIFPTESRASKLLVAWRWLVPDAHESIMVAKFGDWFFKTEKNGLVYLDLRDGAPQDVGHCADIGTEGDDIFLNHQDKLSVDWIEVCLQRGLVTEEDQCYGWKLHPALGGKFEFENIKVFSVNVYQTLMGQLFRQLRHGRKITGLSLTDAPEHEE